MAKHKLKSKLETKRKPRNGFFISLEGTDGAGKSTLFKKIQRDLTKHNYSVVLSREPGGTPLGERIRRLFVEHEMSVWSEVFLLEASRHQNTVEKIIPSLNQKKIVLCDRYADSTTAYQGSGRGLPAQKLKLLNEIATEKLKPDLTIFLDLDPKKSLSRAKNQNRIEQAGLSLQVKARRGFHRAKLSDPRRFFWIDVSKNNANEVFELARKEIQKRMSRFQLKKTRS